MFNFKLRFYENYTEENWLKMAPTWIPGKNFKPEPKEHTPVHYKVYTHKHRELTKVSLLPFETKLL